MTLVVAIKCSDGVVIAADSDAVLGNQALLGQQTVKVTGVTKLKLIGCDLAFGFAGNTALRDSYIARLEQYMKKKKACHYKDGASAMSSLEGMLREKLKPCLHAANAVHNSQLQKFLEEEFLHSTIIAFPTKNDGIQLIEFSSTCKGSIASDELPCIAIGSGQPQADPFLSFLRRVCLGNKPPDVRLASLVAVWVVDITRKHHPGGVGGDISLLSLRQVDNETEIVQFDHGDLRETFEIIEMEEGLLSKALRAIHKLPDIDHETGVLPEP